MSPEFAKLFSRNVGTAFAKQLAFADLLDNRDWSVSISEGKATFGGDLSYPIQLIGTEAEGDGTWLWAWANSQSNLPPAVLHACNTMRELGVKLKVPELTERKISLETANGHMLAMVASGLNSECCYYRGPYDGGALFFLVCNAPSVVTQPVTLERSITVLGEIIAQFEVDHREMAEAFLSSQGFEVSSVDNRLVARRNGESLEIEFDNQNRLEKMQTTLNPRPEPKRSWWKLW